MLEIKAHNVPSSKSGCSSWSTTSHSLDLALSRVDPPNFDKLFLLFTDASDVTVSAILAQLNENKVDHPIAYYNKTLSKVKSNHSGTETKGLTVLLVIKPSGPSCMAPTLLSPPTILPCVVCNR